MEKVTGQEIIDFLSYLSNFDLADTQNLSMKYTVEDYPFPANIIFYDNSVIYTVVVPGVKKENIEISGNGKYLTVSVKAEVGREIENMKSNKVEFTRPFGIRRFPIIEDMIVEEATAVLKDGILTVSVPVKKSQNSEYKIEIE